MDEPAFRELVLKPLLESLGYRDVRVTHSSVEHGKDLVAWRSDDMHGGREVLAIVAKAKSIKGHPIQRDIAGEVLECFKEPYENPTTGDVLQINRCWVAVNKPVAEQTQQHLRIKLRGDYGPLVRVLGLDELWDIWSNQLDKSRPSLIMRAQEVVNAVPESLNFEVTLKRHETRVRLNRHSQESASFEVEELVFSDDRQLAENLDLVFRELEQVQHADLRKTSPTPPSEVEPKNQPKAGEPMTHTTSLEQMGLRVIMSFRFIDPSRGKWVQIPWVEMNRVAGGRGQIVYRNDGQFIPLSIRLTTDLVERTHNVTLSIKDGPVSVHWLSKALLEPVMDLVDWRDGILPPQTVSVRRV